MMSPGSSVITKVMYSTRNSIEKIRLAVLECWRRSPFTNPSITRGPRLPPISMQGPNGAKVSNPLARVYWVSLFWMSRAVTSFRQVTPRMKSQAFAALTRWARRLMTSASSDS